MSHDIIHTRDIILSSSDNKDEALLRKDSKTPNKIFVAFNSQKQKNI